MRNPFFDFRRSRRKGMVGYARERYARGAFVVPLPRDPGGIVAVILAMTIPACAGLVDESRHPCPCDGTGYVCCQSTRQCVTVDQAAQCAGDAGGDDATIDAAIDADGSAADSSPQDRDASVASSDVALDVPSSDASFDGAGADAAPEGGLAAVCPAVDASAGINIATTGYGYGTTKDAILSSTQRVEWTGIDDGTISVEAFDIGPDAGAPSSTSIEPGPDGGRSLPRVMVTSIAVNPWNNLDTMVAMTGQSGGLPNLYRTMNGGQDWTQVGSVASAGITEVWSTSFNPLDPSYIYLVGAPDGTVVESGDDGATWSATRPTGDPIAVGAVGTLVSSAALWKEDPNYVVVGTSNGQVWATADGGGTWTRVNDPSSAPDASAAMPQRPITRVSANPRLSPPILFVTYVEQAADSVWISETGGYLWEAIPTGLPAAGPDRAYAYFGASLQWLTLFPASSGTSQYLQLNGTCGTAFSPDLGAHWTWHPAAAP